MRWTRTTMRTSLQHASTICNSKLFLNFVGKCSVPTNVQEIHYSDFLAAMVLFRVLIFACFFLCFSARLLPLLRCQTFILLNLRSARVFPSTIIFCRPIGKTHARPMHGDPACSPLSLCCKCSFPVSQPSRNSMWTAKFLEHLPVTLKIAISSSALRRDIEVKQKTSSRAPG